MERPINRPLNDQKDYDSEKNQHTIKNNLMVLMSREIVYLSPTYAGSVHDKKICDLEGLSFSKKY
ncbi:MAG: transposase family protein [Bacteroidia bacterium]